MSITTDLSLSERDAIVATTTQAALGRLQLKPGALRLATEKLKREGQWALLSSRVQGADGTRFDYAGTDLHAAAQAGAVSDLCVALLRQQGESWQLQDMALGPTDVAWQGWPAEHQAPASLFA